MNNRKFKKSDYKSKIIARQINEIDRLKQIISTLQISNNEKDLLIKSVEDILQDFLIIIEELKKKKEQYEKLIAELIAMRNALNQIAFKGKWSLIRLLLR